MNSIQIKTTTKVSTKIKILLGVVMLASIVAMFAIVNTIAIKKQPSNHYLDNSSSGSPSTTPLDLDAPFDDPKDLNAEVY